MDISFKKEGRNPLNESKPEEASFVRENKPETAQQNTSFDMSFDRQGGIPALDFSKLSGK